MIPFEKIKQSPLVKQFIENRFDNKNVLVYAEGGFGKTTAMRCLQTYLLDLAQKEKIVPLYIDVKKIDQFSNKPLIHYIYTEYSGSDTKESDAENLFTDQAPSMQYKYKYYILIDGYNEVPVSARFNINSEISNFVQKENVRIILSSRMNEQVDIFEGFKRIFLLGLNDAQIKLYLKKQFQTDFDLEKVNQSLVNILRSPLYMSAFSKTYGRKKPFPELFSEKEVRKGDILDNFIFHSLDKLRPNESINDLLAEFILLYFMPALAFRMYKNESFTITKKEMERLVDDVDYFKSLLDIEKQGKYLGEYSRNIYDIEKICCDNIAVLQRTSYGYEMHNIYRDFFAAKQVINFINAGLINELEIDLDENIRQFVGELIREYDETHLYSRDYTDIENDDRKCECDFETKHNLETAESPIEHFLQCHNLKSSTPLSPISTKNLVEIMKTSRCGKIVSLYDYLDLSKISFSNVCLCNSIFFNTKLCFENLKKSVISEFSFVFPMEICANGYSLLRGVDDKCSRYFFYNYYTDEHYFIDDTDSLGIEDITQVMFSRNKNNIIIINGKVINVLNIKSKIYKSYICNVQIKNLFLPVQTEWAFVETENREIIRCKNNNGTWKCNCKISIPKKTNSVKISNDGQLIFAIGSNNVFIYKYSKCCNEYRLFKNKKFYLTDDNIVIDSRKYETHNNFVNYHVLNYYVGDFDKTVVGPMNLRYYTLKHPEWCAEIMDLIITEDDEFAYILFRDDFYFGSLICKVSLTTFDILSQKNVPTMSLFAARSKHSDLALLFSEAKSLKLFRYENNSTQLLGDNILNVSSPLCVGAISDDGHVFAIGGRKIDFTLIFEKTAKQYSTKSFKNDWKFVRDYNENFLCLADMHGVLYKINVLKNKIISKPLHTGYIGEHRITALKYMKCQDYFVVGTKSGLVAIIDSKTGTLMNSFDFEYEITEISAFADETIIAAFLENNEVKLINLVRHSDNIISLKHRLWIWNAFISISPNGKYLCYIKETETLYGKLVVYEIQNEFRLVELFTVDCQESHVWFTVTNDYLYYTKKNKFYFKSLHQSSLIDFYAGFSLFDTIIIYSEFNYKKNKAILVGDKESYILDLNKKSLSPISFSYSFYLNSFNYANCTFYENNIFIFFEDHFIIAKENEPMKYNVFPIPKLLGAEIFNSQFINCQFESKEDGNEEIHKCLYQNGAKLSEE